MSSSPVLKPAMPKSGTENELKCGTDIGDAAPRLAASSTPLLALLLLEEEEVVEGGISRTQHGAARPRLRRYCKLRYLSTPTLCNVRY
eukprot:225729-Rhodomonas_salina.8